MPKYYSTKTYGTDRGLSCCFRQWKATHSHCSLIHGYSIGIKFVFETDTLDERNWVHDFGSMKEIKKWLDYMFDHTTLISRNDPHLDDFVQLSEKGLIDLRVVPAVGCEKFAELVYEEMTLILNRDRESGKLLNSNVRLKSVEVFEHGANSAIFEG